MLPSMLKTLQSSSVTDKLTELLPTLFNKCLAYLTLNSFNQVIPTGSSENPRGESAAGVPAPWYAIFPGLRVSRMWLAELTRKARL